MKTLTKYWGVVLAGSLWALAPVVLHAQDTSTTTTITSTGTVSAWKPSAIAVKVGSSPAPVDYSFTKTTTYVDENGNPVSRETIQSGAPVTVYYQRQGPDLVADRVVVDRSVTTTQGVPPPPTTTVTTTAPVDQGSPQMNGVVTDSDSDSIDLRTADSPKPIHYKAHDSTAYVDENGNPIPRKLFTRGTAATVYYEKHDGDFYATRVVLQNPAILNR